MLMECSNRLKISNLLITESRLARPIYLSSISPANRGRRSAKTNKGGFNMSREHTLKSATSLLFALILSLTPNVQSQESDELEMSLDDLLNMEITTVSKKAESLADTPMAVYVVSRDELERDGVRTLYELLQRTPGYSFYNTDYYGQYGVIGRGLQSIWRYGFSVELMNVVDFGHFTFTPHFFDSVEVARGPAGLTWGSGAEAGLVNLKLRSDVDGVEVYTGIGNFNRKSVDLLYGKSFEDVGGETGDGIFFGWHLEGQDYRLQEGAALNGLPWKETGLNDSQLFIGKVEYQELKVILMQDHADHISPTLWYGTNGLQQALETFQADAHDQLELLSYRLEYEVPIEKDWIELYLYHDYYKKQWWAESVALMTQRKRAFGFTGEMQLMDERLAVNFGGDLWGEDQVDAPSMTTEYATPYGVDWYDDNLSPTKTEYRNAYVQGKYKLTDHWGVLAGGRVDFEKNAQPDELYFSGPRLGLFCTPYENLTFKYLFNSTQRRPQANESDQGLGPETLEAHELIGIYSVTDELSVDLTLFTQELRDQITKVEYTSDLNLFRNMGGLKTSGLEWGVKYFPLPDVMLFANGSYLDAKVIEAYDTDSNGALIDVSSPHLSNGRPLFVPRFTSFAGCDVNISKYAKATLALRTIYDIPYQDMNTGADQNVTANFVDFSLRSKEFWGKTTLSFYAFNIFNFDKLLPGYGEHADNGARLATGMIEPESRRFYLELSTTF